MKYKNLFWGIILVFLGILGILNNFDLIYFSWHKLWNIWPVLLILWGISVLPVKDNLKLVLVLATLGFTLYYIADEAVDAGRDSDDEWIYEQDDDESYNDDTTVYDTATGQSVLMAKDKNASFLIPYPEDIRTAKLDLDAVAGHFILKNTTSNLATFNINDSYLAEKYTYFVKTEDTVAKVNITTRKHTDIHLDGHDATATLKLNEKPVWEVNVNAGAAELDLDFSSFKVKKLNIDAGAASINIKLGDMIKRTKVDINAGAAEITIKVPQKAACVVDFDTFLSDTELTGFIKKNGKYYSENYDNSDIKIEISIDSAISDLNIITY